LHEAGNDNRKKNNSTVKVNVNMPKLWIMALDNYAKNNGFKNRAVAIRSLFYPAFQKELRLLDPSVNIEPIIEHKKIIKKSSMPKKIKRLKKALKEASKRYLHNDFECRSSGITSTIKKIETVREDKRKRITVFRDFTIEKPKPYRSLTVTPKPKKRIHVILNEPEFKINLGWKKPRRKKEWKVSVPIKTKHELRPSEIRFIR